MFSNKIAGIIGFAAIIVGILVCIAWVLDIQEIKSIIPNAAPMRFTAGLLFIVSGTLLYSLTTKSGRMASLAQITVPISVFIILLVSTTVLVGYTVGLNTGIEQLFAGKTPTAAASGPSQPPIPTLVSFVLISIMGVLEYHATRLRNFVRYLGCGVLIVGAVSVIGYITNQPSLYYYVNNGNAGMAIHTSILFVAIGIGFILLQKNPIAAPIRSLGVQMRIFATFLSTTIVSIIVIVVLVLYYTADLTNFKIITLQLLTITSILIVAMAIFSLLISKSISKPIVALQNTSRQISQGHHSLKADETGNDEMAELGKAFNQMVTSVMKAERFSTLGEMSARLAHDIRNPLSVIKLNISLLQNQIQKSDDEKFLKRMDAINRSMKRIEHQIDDVLGYVNITPLRLANVSVLEILSEAVKTTPIQEGITVILPKNDLKITCDEKKLTVVFSNLILNAVQAVGESGTITINLRNEMGRVLVEITDTGPGIAEENMEKIFEPLFTTKQTGTGLGLVTCKNIVRQHHGMIHVKNNPTTFTVVLPVTQ